MIVTRISSTKSFKLERLRGFTSFMKKIGQGRDGGNGDEITVSEIELREWSEPNPALGIKEAENELSISSNSFMKKAPPAPRTSKDIENDRIEKRMELTEKKNKKISTTLVDAMKHEIRQMKQDKQNVKRKHCEQMKQMKQQMKQQQQEMEQQSKKMDDIMQTVKQLKKEI